MKIVLGTDGSQYAQWALAWAAHLPLTNARQAVAVHALDLGSLKAPVMVQWRVAGNAPFIKAEARRREREARRISTETRASLRSLGLSGQVAIEQWAPATMIFKHAKRGDLIVVGSRGLTGLDRFMLGSVSTQVVQHAPCSVLVVKQPPRARDKILLAMDGSKESEKAARFLVQSLRALKAEVFVVHVMPHYHKFEAAGQAVVDRYGEQLTSAGYRVTSTLKVGHPAEEIVKVAERQKVNLIVAGAKGLRAVGRFFLGSVSTKLVQHSPCSVLVVR
jgi:nucleotide-binding universal stress UspA family protein